MSMHHVPLDLHSHPHNQHPRVCSRPCLKVPGLHFEDGMSWHQSSLHSDGPSRALGEASAEPCWHAFPDGQCFSLPGGRWRLKLADLWPGREKLWDCPAPQHGGGPSYPPQGSLPQPQPVQSSRGGNGQPRKAFPWVLPDLTTHCSPLSHGVWSLGLKVKVTALAWKLLLAPLLADDQLVLAHSGPACVACGPYSWSAVSTGRQLC